MIRPNVAKSHHHNNPQQHQASPGGPPRTFSNSSGGTKRPRHYATNAATNKPLSFSMIAFFMVVALLGMGMMTFYSIQYVSNVKNMDSSSSSNNLRKVIHTTKAQAQEAIQHVQKEFEQRYGSYSSTLLERGIQSFGSIEATAQRMVQASQAGRPLVMAFSGYSVTVGRGNFFNQSFPFVMERILKEPFQQVLGLDLVVRNAAIGGIPSFPYGFCLEHFLGNDPDVISWDYSMNEGPKDSSVLEAFIRQSQQQLPKQPMMIVLDSNAQRIQLLKDYTERRLLADAIAIVGRKEIVDDSVFQQDPLPKGFQQWEEFGAPQSCPGRGSWHPKKQEHAMMGWMIAMHFLQALELAFEMMQKNIPDVQHAHRDLDDTTPRFPSALSSSIPQNNDPEVTELLFGHEEPENNNLYYMKDVSCRTSFLPATDHTKVLPSIVVSGMVSNEVDDIMMERTDEQYQKGWVFDVSKVERDTKLKVDKCGGLGYVDMKIALYGIPQSGTLRLWLPFEKSQSSHDHHDHNDLDTDGDTDHAKHWFDDLILCEANEKRGDEACKLDQDLEIVVGDSRVTTIHPIHGAGEYLRRKTCVNVGVPNDAVITKLGQVTTTAGNNGSSRLLSKEEKLKFGGNDETIGLVVDITAKSKVTRTDGACCLSHVVWEMH